MTDEHADLPTQAEVDKLDKRGLDRLLEEVCMRLYRIMGRETYDRIVLQSVRRLQRGIGRFVAFVKWALDVLRTWPGPVSLFT